jgi:hypothetical protein
MIQTRPIPTSSIRILALAATALLQGISAQATLVLPGTSYESSTPLGPATNIAATGSLSGTVIADQTTAFAESLSGFFTGNIRSLVVRRTDTATLDFYYQLVNNTVFEEFPNDADIFVLSIENFAGFGFPNNDALDLIVRTDGLSGLTGLASAGTFVNGNLAATAGFRDPQAAAAAGFIFATLPTNFIDDPNNIGKGDTSNFIVIRSAATDFAAAPAFITGTFGTAVTQGYAPVPEPTVAGLTAIGVLGLGLRRRRAAAR